MTGMMGRECDVDEGAEMISNTRREFLTLGTTAAVGLAIPRGSWAIGTGAGCPMFKGVNFGYYIRNGQLSSPKTVREVEKIAALGIEWVCLIVTVMQETFCSARQFRDFEMTPGDDEIVDIVQLFHKKGVKVMLRPMMECWDGTQRTHIHLPEGQVFNDRPYHYRTDWFRNYEKLTRHYCRLAEKTGCEAYGLDSELNQLVPCTKEWLKVIDVARKTYRGHLTTCLSCVIWHKDLIKDKNHWFYALDSLGTSFYHCACPVDFDNVDPTQSPDDILAKPFVGLSAEEMAANLERRVVPRYREFAEIYGRPVYMGEIGCCSAAGACALPGYWRNPHGYDGAEQANYLEGVIRAFRKESWWKGLLWWKWDENNDRPQYHNDPAGDKGFTIDGKPAAQVMRRWCANEF